MGNLAQWFWCLSHKCKGPINYLLVFIIRNYVFVFSLKLFYTVIPFFRLNKYFNSGSKCVYNGAVASPCFYLMLCNKLNLGLPVLQGVCNEFLGHEYSILTLS